MNKTKYKSLCIIRFIKYTEILFSKKSYVKNLSDISSSHKNVSMRMQNKCLRPVNVQVRSCIFIGLNENITALDQMYFMYSTELLHGVVSKSELSK